MESSLADPDPGSELSYEKKENGHRCGAYHKVSDAKVRMTKATEYLM